MCIPLSHLRIHVKDSVTCICMVSRAAECRGMCLQAVVQQPIVLCACRYAFFDTDNVIERAHPGETVADIFSKYGEEYFRNCESQVI